MIFLHCSRQPEKIPDLPVLQQPGERVIIYQLMVRLFGNKRSVNKTFGTLNENGSGTMSDINDAALQGIRELGATHVWYTGIIEHASCTSYPEYGIKGDDPDVVKGVAGSPYSIRDYYDVHPDLAVQVVNRIKEFEELVQRTHRNGLKVIIDFVPNHVARSYRSDARPHGIRDIGQDDNPEIAFSPRNNFYYLPGEKFRPPKLPFSLPGMDNQFDEFPARATANDVFSPQPEMTDWYEAVKLNYGIDLRSGGEMHFHPIPDTWVKMRDILLYWTEKGVDGFRCDVAWMVPLEFWNWVIPQVRARNPNMLFIAELYDPSLYRQFIERGRFDLLYDKVQLYDTLRLLIEGKSHTRSIASISAWQKDIDRHLLHFMENHDEQRIASPYFAGNAWAGLPAMVVSATLDRGGILIYFGQEVGEPALGDPGFQSLEKKGVTTKMDYWGVPEHQKWMNGGAFDGGQLSDDQRKLRHAYKQLLHIAGQSEALRSGTFTDLTQINQEQGNISSRIVCFFRHTNTEKLLVIAGFNRFPERITIEIPGSMRNTLQWLPSTNYLLTDLMSGEQMEFTEKIQLQLPPYGYYIFKVQ